MKVCPVCKKNDCDSVFKLPNIPTLDNVLADTKEEAQKAILGKMSVFVCNFCGFVFNGEYDEKLTVYKQGYHAERGVSQAHRSYIKSIIARLNNLTDFNNGFLLEVACGTGEFLQEIYVDPCGEKFKKLMGVDPSATEQEKENVVIKSVFFDNNFVKRVPHIDVLINRHFIEHLKNPFEMLEIFSDNLPSGSILYLETPRLDWILDNNIFFDFPYEHCSYFSDDFMKRMVASLGFTILESKNGYDGQYFSMFLKKDNIKSVIKKVERKELLRLKKNFQNMNRVYNICKKMFIPDNSTILWGGGVALREICGLIYLIRFVECTL